MKPNRPKSSEPSQRQLRVGEQIKHIIADTMRRGYFSGGDNITVTEVRVTPDLKNAKAYITVMSGEDLASSLDALNEEARIFQKEISNQSNLKFTPRVAFIEDISVRKAGRIEDILREIHIPDDED